MSSLNKYVLVDLIEELFNNNNYVDMKKLTPIILSGKEILLAFIQSIKYTEVFCMLSFDFHVKLSVSVWL